MAVVRSACEFAHLLFELFEDGNVGDNGKMNERAHAHTRTHTAINWHLSIPVLSDIKTLNDATKTKQN